MKTPLRIVLLTSSFLLHPSSFLLAQGSLTPPGAPAPTMKTLDQVEPRIAITSLPLVILQSGSYYLTKSFLQNFTGLDALTIGADNVTVDFAGFSIVQTGTTAAIAGLRIQNGVGVPLRNAVVKNGTIAGFAAPGIVCLGARNCLIEDMHVTQCAIGMSFQPFGTAAVVGNTFRRCRTTDNASGSGITLTSGGANIGNVIENCQSLNNSTGFAFGGGGGNLIIGCRASGNTGNNYTIAIGNRMGLIVLPGTNPAQINGSSNVTGTGATDPFVNLSY